MSDKDEAALPPIDVNVRYTLHIEAEWEDSGDYMRNGTLEEFMRWAQSQAQHLKVFIKEGGGETRPVRARITVGEVRIVSRTGS